MYSASHLKYWGGYRPFHCVKTETSEKITCRHTTYVESSKVVKFCYKDVRISRHECGYNTRNDLEGSSSRVTSHSCFKIPPLALQNVRCWWRRGQWLILFTGNRWWEKDVSFFLSSHVVLGDCRWGGGTTWRALANRFWWLLSIHIHSDRSWGVYTDLQGGPPSTLRWGNGIFSVRAHQGSVEGYQRYLHLVLLTRSLVTTSSCQLRVDCFAWKSLTAMLKCSVTMSTLLLGTVSSLVFASICSL